MLVVKTWFKTEKILLFCALVSCSFLYLNLVWKNTENIDRLTTDALFYAAILGLVWRRKEQLTLKSSWLASFLGLIILVAILIKSLSLFEFESTLLPLIPLFTSFSLALIASGFKGLFQYKKELLLSCLLFFPTGVIGSFIDNTVKITIINAKFATYFLYYFGFNVVNRGNEIILFLSNAEQYKAIVDYPCAGVPMILLMLKLSLILVSFFAFARSHSLLIPLVSIAIGFILGVIRVSILTLVLPTPDTFNYWHGSEGSQIFSTLAIIIFSAFAYWILERQETFNI